MSTPTQRAASLQDFNTPPPLDLFQDIVAEIFIALQSIYRRYQADATYWTDMNHIVRWEEREGKGGGEGEARGRRGEDGTEGGCGGAACLGAEAYSSHHRHM